MTPDLATFRIMFEEFDPVADAKVQFYIDDASGTLDEGSWGLCYPKAVLNYAAHLLDLALQRKASAVDTGDGGVVIPQTGVLASGSEEGISFAFAQSSTPKSFTQEWLSQTPYGQAYLALQRECLSRAELSW
jgi:hypothetical protein